MKFVYTGTFFLFSAIITALCSNTAYGDDNKLYVQWDFGKAPSGSSTYLVACTDPTHNYNPSRNDCTEVDWSNNNVSDKVSFTMPLREGVSLEVCLTADNNPSIGRGRWSSCKSVIPKSSSKRIMFHSSQFVFVGRE
jgi:hypothetical protein